MRMNEVNTAENGAPENLEDRRESESTEKQDDLGEEEDSAAERPYKHHYVPLPSRYTIQQLTPNLNLLVSLANVEDLFLENSFLILGYYWLR